LLVLVFVHFVLVFVIVRVRVCLSVVRVVRGCLVVRNHFKDTRSSPSALQYLSSCPELFGIRSIG
jgi:hypothetical protein